MYRGSMGFRCHCSLAQSAPCVSEVLSNAGEDLASCTMSVLFFYHSGRYYPCVVFFRQIINSGLLTGNPARVEMDETLSNTG